MSPADIKMATRSTSRVSDFGRFSLLLDCFVDADAVGVVHFFKIFWRLD